MEVFVHERIQTKVQGVIIHSGILVDYKNKMAKDTTMKLMLFERAYSKVLLCI